MSAPDHFDDGQENEEWNQEHYHGDFFEVHDKQLIVATILSELQERFHRGMKDCFVYLNQRALLMRREDYDARRRAELEAQEQYELIHWEIEDPPEWVTVLRNGVEYRHPDLNELFRQVDADTVMTFKELQQHRYNYIPGFSMEVFLERFIDELILSPNTIKLEELFPSLLEAGQYPSVHRKTKDFLRSHGLSHDEIASLYDERRYRRFRAAYHFRNVTNEPAACPWSFTSFEELDGILPSSGKLRSAALTYYLDCLPPHCSLRQRQILGCLMLESDHDIAGTAERMLGEPSS